MQALALFKKNATDSHISEMPVSSYLRYEQRAILIAYKMTFKFNCFGRFKKKKKMID